MKKRLLCLPLVAAMLGGCTVLGFDLSKLDVFHWFTNNNQTGGGNNTTGGNTSGGNTTGGNTTGGGTVEVGSKLVLDFSTSAMKENQVTPYVSELNTLYNFTYEGVTYNDRGCFADLYSGDYYLMMKNKLANGDNTSPADIGENWAFIGNADEYDKPITSVEVELRNGGSAKTQYHVAFGDSAFTLGDVSKSDGNGSQASFTVTGNGKKFFAITAFVQSSEKYAKNGQIKKITINF